MGEVGSSRFPSFINLLSLSLLFLQFHFVFLSFCLLVVSGEPSEYFGAKFIKHFSQNCFFDFCSYFIRHDKTYGES